MYFLTPFVNIYLLSYLGLATSVSDILIVLGSISTSIWSSRNFIIYKIRYCHWFEDEPKTNLFFKFNRLIFAFHTITTLDSHLLM